MNMKRGMEKLVSAVSKNSTVKFAIEIFGLLAYRRVIKWMLFPFIFLTVLLRRALGYNDISKIDFVITTKCSLKCKHCSNLMQFYGKDTVPAKDYGTEDIFNDIHKLLALTDRIWQLVLVGGEPFMNKDLVKILRKLLSFKKIKLINIVTNGTIVPDEELMAVLKSPKIQVTVSDYGEVAKNRDKLLEVLRCHNVKHKLLAQMLWVDRGEITVRGRTEEELMDLFRVCVSKCTTLMGGKMYNCEVYSNGVNLGYIDELEDEVIDIRNITREDFSSALRTLISRKYIHACDYCGEVAYNENNTVKAGIQL